MTYDDFVKGFDKIMDALMPIESHLEKCEELKEVSAMWVQTWQGKLYRSGKEADLVKVVPVIVDIN